ncbi:hypothetical protein FRB94_003473 [Tulasnella sp. JGI-2019a]|nr:hypothetical protein FRB93_000527 [Tulasnella sp. JGI-2019a]KAG9002946.1 hypothetical protein FRB94_003473 [Tulasnella sp. JGI-2019a]
MARRIRRIAILGDSGGGGLALALLQHLGYLASGSSVMSRLLPPMKMVLYSPWVDLTCSLPSFNANMWYDLAHPTMFFTAAWGYTATVRRDAANREFQPVKVSLQGLVLRHPLFPPALEPAVTSFRRVAEYAVPGMFIIWGTAEMWTMKSAVFATISSRQALGVKSEGIDGRTRERSLLLSRLWNEGD